eukprot:CAMPEP_0114122636 /NCGR_PEP_ID=MMETSP0043_2-20121206/7802_1 /TAXON_ID=464988 /ORGANISM="Hemiselmis andersenii, Strain CCMP644" /LENGTH=55 /DNA_ID=CAMNT_0001215367 /DNA_START=666 /DNA_END=833 /DNA_ORIENTATION=+
MGSLHASAIAPSGDDIVLCCFKAEAWSSLWSSLSERRVNGCGAPSGRVGRERGDA